MILAALPEGAVPLAVGTALAMGALTLVLSPLLGDDTTSRPRTDDAQPPRPRDGRGDIPSDSAVVALREIEFDRETGKLSDSDYAELKARYTQIALAEMRANVAADGPTATDPVLSARSPASTDAAAPQTMAGAEQANTPVDPVEAAIQRARDAQRSCGACGPRPEPDAVYCSNCGQYLAGACRECGTPVEVAGSHFCTHCGESLAAV